MIRNARRKPAARAAAARSSAERLAGRASCGSPGFFVRSAQKKSGPAATLGRAALRCTKRGGTSRAWSGKRHGRRLRSYGCSVGLRRNWCAFRQLPSNKRSLMWRASSFGDPGRVRSGSGFASSSGKCSTSWSIRPPKLPLLTGRRCGMPSSIKDRDFTEYGRSSTIAPTFQSDVARFIRRGSHRGRAASGRPPPS